MTTNQKETTMLWACVKCTARRAAELLHCPHCGEAEYQEAPGGEVEPGAPMLNAVQAVPDEAAVAKPKPAKPKPDVPAETAPSADAAPAAG